MTRPAMLERTRIIRDEHTDLLGHVNNVIWLELIIELAVAHQSSLGLDAQTREQVSGIWIVHRHEIDYHRPARPGEEIREQTWISTARGARSVRNTVFTRISDGEKLVSAVTHWAYVDAQTGRPRRIEPAVLEALRVLADPH